jgi:hypothetical protein
MPLYEVTVERTEQATLWIEADDKAAARLDADELTDAIPENEWEFFDKDICIAPRAELPAHADRVWVGGEDGDWLERDEYEPEVQP